jgi:hypothetical protein
MACCMLADRILLLNTYSSDLVDWVDEVLTVVLGLDTPENLPPIVDADDINKMSKMSWLGFENYLVVTDRYPLPLSLLHSSNAPHAVATATLPMPVLVSPSSVPMKAQHEPLPSRALHAPGRKHLWGVCGHNIAVMISCM